MNKFQQMSAQRNKKANKKKETRKAKNEALNAFKKQKAANETKSEEAHFLFKGHSQNVPSKVPKPRLNFSPLKVLRETTSQVKCGYNSKAEAYVHSSDGYNPFDAYAIQNLGTLESFIHVCCAHARDSGCQGKVQFLSAEEQSAGKLYSGTLFSIHTAQCTGCGCTFQLESDYFERKPIPSDSMNSYSRISQVCGLASKNMSWIFSEMQMLFACLGVAFSQFANFRCCGITKDGQLLH